MGKQSYLNAAAHGYARRSYTQLFAQVLHLRKQLFPQRTIMRKRQVKMHASSQQHTTLDSTGVLKECAYGTSVVRLAYTRMHAIQNTSCS